MTRAIHQFICSSLRAWAYSKMTMPGFIRLKLWKSGSGAWDWLATTKSRPEPHWEPLRRLFTVGWLSHHQYKPWGKLNATPGENKSCHIVEAYRKQAIQQNIRAYYVFFFFMATLYLLGHIASFEKQMTSKTRAWVYAALFFLCWDTYCIMNAENPSHLYGIWAPLLELL